MKNYDCINQPLKKTDVVDEKILEKTVEILAAMADGSRLEILFLLSEHGEVCVSEISSALGHKANTISMRLKKLHSAGLVAKRRDAKHIFYRLVDEHVVTIVHNAIAHAKHLNN